MPSKITSWKAFARNVRARQEQLLPQLDRFPRSILITGCQRSGGTMLSRLITHSPGMTNFWFSKDEELDAAQILSGHVDYRGEGRHCFQTTYLNECFREYQQPDRDFYLVWSLRNPASVAYSMLYNWRDFALNELFLTCGYALMSCEDRVRFQRWGLWGIPRVRRAAYAYAGKVSQLFEIVSMVPAERLTVLEYDELVRDKQTLLPALYARLDLAFDEQSPARINDRSLQKANKLNEEERQVIASICDAVYQRARGLVNLAR